MKQEFGYNEAGSLAKNIQSSSNNMKDLLDRSDSEVKKIQGNWEGSSADYAIENWNSWKKDFEEYYQMLLQNVKNIETACKEYMEAEAKMQQNYH